jgi:hypothetical protein
MEEVEPAGWNFSPKNLLVFGLCVWGGAVLCLLLGVFMRNICTVETPIQVKIDPIHINPEIKVMPSKVDPPVVNVQSTAPVINIPQQPAPTVNVHVERDESKLESKPESKPEPKSEKKTEVKSDRPERVASAPEQKPVLPPAPTEEEKYEMEHGKLLPPPRKAQ